MAGLTGAQTQAKEQTKRLLDAEGQLQIAKEQINDLKKKLIMAENAKGVAEFARDEAVRAKQEAKFTINEAEAARDKAEEEGYETGVAETQTSLKAQIPGVCRLILLPGLGRGPQTSWGGSFVQLVEGGEHILSSSYS